MPSATRSKRSTKVDPSLKWHVAMSSIKARVFKIRTPRGHGTGFHLGNFGKLKNLCAVATAFHVVEEAEDWGEPLKLIHAQTQKQLSLKDEHRAIFTYPDSDLAIIVFASSRDLVMSDDEVELLPSLKRLSDGVEIAWCGYPGIAEGRLCFFHGFTSAFIDAKKGYLVDGVAINGVSGGPVFYLPPQTQRPVVVGVVTAYIANKGVLPGVSMIAPVSPFEKRIKFLQNLGEASDAAAEESERKTRKPDATSEVESDQRTRARA